jgi:hypothetical protein
LTLPAAWQLPLQVMVQLPVEQLTLDPGPTVCVQLAPLQLTLHEGPQVPEHVAPRSQ